MAVGRVVVKGEFNRSRRIVVAFKGEGGFWWKEKGAGGVGRGIFEEGVGCGGLEI